jgi:conjugative transposon TraK protein
MFKKPRDIESSFRAIRGICLVTIAGCLLFAAFTTWQSRSLVSRIQSKIYILFNGKVLEAVAADRKDNVAVEAKDHVRTFHQLFFTLTPDDKAIKSGVTQALYLADESAKKEYDNLSESGYYANIIAGNISQQIRVDSVQLDLDHNPYVFRCYATQHMVRTTSTVTRSLITTGELRSVPRSENNPHGFLIQRWTTLENKDLKVENH